VSGLDIMIVGKEFTVEKGSVSLFDDTCIYGRETVYRGVSRRDSTWVDVELAIVSSDYQCTYAGKKVSDICGDVGCMCIRTRNGADYLCVSLYEAYLEAAEFDGMFKECHAARAVMNLFVSFGDGCGYQCDLHARGDDTEGRILRIKAYRLGYRYGYDETFVRELCK
jgi:hypothetical protein